MKRIQLIATIFFITFSSIVIEILYTRVFSMIYFSSFAFLMISLALFGYGLSGVFMSISETAKKKNAIRLLEYFILGLALSLPLVYKITLTAKVDFLNLLDPPSHLLPLILNVLVLIVPFFMAGVCLVLLFSLFSDQIGRLYFVDLAGAALGGLAVIPLITSLGPSRIILLISFVILLLWSLISRMRPLVRAGGLVALTVILSILFLHADALFPVVPKLKKREYLDDHRRGLIEYSQWSPINKIDIAPESQYRKNMWLNGGTQQSWLVRHSREIEATKKPIKWFHQSIPFQLTRKGSAFIIGSAGGYEVLCALTHKFKEIYAVEMDPAICHIISETEYADYIGKIFRRKGVHLIADEGRSVLKRMKGKRFDVIQMVNSHPTDTLLSGGLSVAETYIYTVESMKDYWNHLNDEGFLSIVHVFGERLFSTAVEALREMNIPEPEKKFFIIQAKNGFNYFFLKKGDIDEEDSETLTTFARKLRRMFPVEVVYAPHLEKDNTYYKLISPDGAALIARSSVNISPVHDHSPYFNQPNKIGQFRFKNNYVAGIARLMIDNARNRSNSVYLTILVVSVLFSLLFIVFPLARRSRGRGLAFAPILYFFLIGMGFIIIEIILIKIFQLYLGNPAYSISVIIFSLLLSSGVGSLMSDRFQRWMKRRTVPIFTAIIVLVVTAYIFLLFPIVYSLIHLGLFFRFLVSLALISILGIPMGVFFPIGLKYLGQRDRVMIGWAWGANAFATVLGSVAAVITAINWNFGITLLVAALCYGLAGTLFHKFPRQQD